MPIVPTEAWQKNMEGEWEECGETGLCDRCFERIPEGAQMLVCPDEPGPNPRSWDAYCSEECRDARQTVLSIADGMEKAAGRLRNS